jgi:ribokinase
VTILGSINMDVVLRVPRFPMPGETILSAAVTRHPGGKGANQAIAVARAGAFVRMLGAVGDDADGREMLRLFDADGIDCAGVVITDQATGTAYVLVDETGENQIIVSPGANSGARTGGGTSDGILLAQLELPLATVASFLSERRPGALAILNAAPFHPDARPLLSLADIVLINEIELAGYSTRATSSITESDAIELASALADRPEQTVIVTRGKEGSIAVGPEGVIATPAKPAQVVDTTGAGDCFCGFLVAGIAAGRTLKIAIRQAHEAAAIVVGRWGAASSIPFLVELD